MEYTNSQIRSLIEEHCHNALDRKMLCLRLIDGMTFEEIAFETDLTPKTVRKRIHRQEELLFKHLPKTT